MGLFDKAKELFEKGQCLIGLHKGQWSYVRAGDCEMKYICQRATCNHVAHKTEHYEWSVWKYVANGECDQTRNCTRCNELEKQISHPFGAWRYVYKNDCTQECVCARCGEKEHQIVHTFSDKVYYTFPNDCYGYNLCSRCGSRKAIILPVHEEWKIIKDKNGEPYLKECYRCKKLENI